MHMNMILLTFWRCRLDIFSIREKLRYKTIYEIPLRVTYYARVSSESDEQLNSLGNQITYYEDLIRRNSVWTFVPGYIDEGLSGISTKKRENFNRMIEDASFGIFDLVITKEISRFVRNTLDSIMFTRQLMSCGVGVFFQNDNINTLDEDSELRLSIMSSIAQAEGMGYLMLSTATKDCKRILHFYLDELGMDFWSARLFKKL